MIVSLPGAAALVVAATGLALLVPVLGILGTMSWSVIGKGLAVIAAALLAISIAGAIAAPGLILLGAALAILGVGVLAVGAGVKLLAGGIQILAGEGTKGLAVFFAALAGLIALMPKIVIDFVKGLIEIVSQIAQLAPKIIGAMVTIMTLVLEATVKLAPKFAQAATAIIQAIITTLGANAGPIIKAGWELLLQLLKGISDHIGQVVDQVGDIVVKFLNAVSAAHSRIVTAGFNVLLNFLRGIANNLNRVLDTAVDIVIELAKGIANNLSRIISAGASIVGSVISGIMNNIEDLIGRGAAMVNRVITGIGNNIDELIKQGVRMAAKVISGIADAAVDLAEAGGNALLHVLRGIRKWVDDNAKDVGTEGRKLAVSLGNGIVSGALGIDLSGFVRSVIGKIKGAIHSIKSFFHIKSPSQYVADEIGIPLVQGVAMGMEMAAPEMLRAGDTLITTLRKIIADVPNQVDMDVNPTITPVLDLTRIKQDAKQLGDISTTTPIQLAAEISAARQAQLEEGGDPEMGARIFKFEQHNTSPESLSEAEIYRQTSNQLSQAKSALGL
jgi:phage-related protein